MCIRDSYLPDDYKYSIQGLNGLTVTNFAQNGFTISGTPTDDVNIKPVSYTHLDVYKRQSQDHTKTKRTLMTKGRKKGQKK